jgi:hypothetical protein
VWSKNTIALTYFLMSGALIYASKWNHFFRHAPELTLVASMSALQTSIAFLFIAFIVIQIRRDIDDLFVSSLIAILALFDAIWVDCNLLTNNIYPGNVGYSSLIIDAASVNGSLIAAAVPSLFEVGIFPVLLCLIAVVASKSSIPYGVLAVSISAYFFYSKQTKRILWGLAAIILGLVFERELLFNSSGRFAGYKLFMTEWWNNSVTLFGPGLNSFQFIGPIVQQKHRYLVDEKGSGAYFMQLHSDWLQVLFESGVVGLAITIALFICVATRLYKSNEPHSRDAFVFWCGIGSAAIFSYPFRFLVPVILAAMCVQFAYQRNDPP